MKLGFIGTGNMASAIIEGIVGKGFISGKDLFLYDILEDKLKMICENIDANLCKSEKEVVERADTVVLSVKPNMIEKVLSKTKDIMLQKNTIVISIAAAMPIEKLEGFLGGKKLSVIRVMPNVNSMIGFGAAAVAGNKTASEENINYVINMFESVGKAWKVEEKDFSAYIALAGSSPAYTYFFIDSLSRAGVKHGLPKDKALEYAAQAVLGSAEMILKSGENPWTLIDKVCSSGGSTVAGLLAMEESGFMTSIIKCVDATIKRDQDMSKE